jgi:hypothetical protein
MCGPMPDISASRCAARSEYRTNPPRSRLGLTAAALLWLVTDVASGHTNPDVTADRATVTQAICRQYAAAQHTLPYGTMHAHCMYARGYRVLVSRPCPILQVIRASCQSLRLITGALNDRRTHREHHEGPWFYG